MIKHIFKVIWNERRSNGWIFAELLIVVAILWVMMDSLLVDTYTYNSPMGYDIENVYKVTVDKLSAGMPGYVPDSLLATSSGEDMFRLMDNLMDNPQVESACMGSSCCPYNYSQRWSSLIRSDADTTEEAGVFRRYQVTEGYFDLFRMKGKDGQAILPVVKQTGGKIVVTTDLEASLFDDGNAMGKSIKFGSNSTYIDPIAAVCMPIRANEYKKSEGSYFVVQSHSDMVKYVSKSHPLNIDFLVRMKPGFKADEMETFLQSITDRLTVNNIYLSCVTPLSGLRAAMLKEPQDTMKKKSALVGFMLVNVLFGIVGTFWLRTQRRRGEMGLRMALGSGHRQLQGSMRVEGLILLLLTIPFVLLFIMNMLYFDMPDTYRLGYTWWRFALTFAGAYGLMAAMICLGIWLPTRKVVQMAPAEALRYE